MARTSSTNKAARLAQRSGGQKIRFQGGSLFPLTIAAIILVGTALVVYAKLTIPEGAADQPGEVAIRARAAYGLDLCGEWYQIDSTDDPRDPTGQFTGVNFVGTGIHSHADGIVAMAGTRTTLGDLLGAYDIELTDDSLTIPAGLLPGAEAEYVDGTTTCGDTPGVLTVTSWSAAGDPASATTVSEGLADVPLAVDGSVVVLSFAPEGTEASMPEWAGTLPEPTGVSTENPSGTVPGTTPESTPEPTTEG